MKTLMVLSMFILASCGSDYTPMYKNQQITQCIEQSPIVSTNRERATTKCNCVYNEIETQNAKSYDELTAIYKKCGVSEWAAYDGK